MERGRGLSLTLTVYRRRMESAFLWAEIALCLFSLGALARHDWPRLTLSTRRVMAQVTGHRTGWDEAALTFAAIYRFTDESGTHEVIDAVYSARPQPPVGTQRELSYPVGHPALARPPRPWLWLTVYLLLIGLAGLLFARWMDWLPA